ncbi:MAG TPA: hypothetical protein VHZ07_20690 [Bryobacteraceae bacterium]|jgi:hypothetical protein|nr:hypothetical protein [Bryobacteraceae bacterium]
MIRGIRALAGVLAVSAILMALGVEPANAQNESYSISLYKSHTPINGYEGDPMPAGGSGSFSLSLENTGTTQIYGTFTITDVLNPAFVPGTASGSGWDCSASSGQTISCTVTMQYYSGLSRYCALPAITIPFTTAAGASGTIANSASATFTGGPDSEFPDLSTTSNTDQVQVLPAPQFTVTKTHFVNGVSAGPAAPGSTGTFNIGLQNTGSAAIPYGSYSLIDTFDARLIPGNASGTGWECATTGQLVECTYIDEPSDPLPTGASLPAVNIPFTVVATASGTVTNTATIGFNASEGNPPIVNASGSDQILVVTPAQLTVTETHTPANGTVGGSIPASGAGSFSIVVSNSGVTATFGTFTVTDTLNAAFTVGAPSGTGWNCAGSTGQTVQCTTTISPSAPLAAEANLNVIAIPITVSTTASGTISNTATVQGRFQNLPAGSGSGTDHVLITPPSIITLTKTHIPTGGAVGGSIAAGGSGAFNLVVANAGSTVITGTFTVTDSLNAAFTPGTVAASGWNCASTSGQNVSCTITTTLGVGASLSPISIPVTVASTASGTIANIANVQFLASIGNLPAVSATGTDQVQVSSAAQITLMATHTPTGGSMGGTIPAGGSGVFSLVVTNTGSSTIDGSFTVTDTLNAAFVPGAVGGSGWNCTGSSGQSVTCTIPANLAAGASLNPVSIPVTAASTASGTIPNAAAAQFLGSVGNPPAVNVTGTDQVQVSPAAQIILTNTHMPTGGNAGGNIPSGGSGAFALVVTNSGSSPINGAFTVTDTLNSAFTVGTVSGNGWNCGGSSSQTVTCTISANVAAGVSLNTISIPVTVAASASGTITNTANVQFVSAIGNAPAVTASGADQVQIGTPVTTLTSPSPGTLQAGSTGNVLTILVGNSGSASTSGTLTLTYTLNSAFTPGAAGGTGWACASQGQVISCSSSAALASGASSSISVPVSILASASGSIANTISLTGGNSAAPSTLTQTVAVAPLSVTLAVPTSAVSTVDANATINARVTSALNTTFVLTFLSNTSDTTPVCDETIGINDTLVAATPSATGINCQVTTTLALAPGSLAQTITIHTGSTAGAITVQIFAPSQPSTPIQQEQIVIVPAKPTIRTMTLTRSGNTLTVSVNPGFTNTRDLSNATFQFTAASGSTLQTSTITVDISSLAASFFQGPNGVSSNGITPGGTFSYSQTFTLTGDASTIASVTLTLSNSTGQASDPVTAQ